jgi:choline dehydrogenase-like flavoprotein
MTTARNANRLADVVVAGGGWAGATLAARLSQDPSRHVVLLEAGQALAPDEVSNLRIVDASIIPRIPSTVTNLTTIMLAERIFSRAYVS